MKTLRIIFSGIAISALFLLTGCNHVNEWDDDHNAPSEPENVRAYADINYVDVYWDHVPDRDVAGYNIYFSYSYNGDYELLGTTRDNNFSCAFNNGESYYFAVTAFDYDGNESNLSKDIPKSEGFNQTIFDYNTTPDKAGYCFSKYLVVPFDDKLADIFFENYNGTYYLDVWAADTDIQDMGPTYDIYDILYAPTGGWIPANSGENIKYAEAKVGHTYVIWTQDSHYAKVRIKNITSNRLVFDWAYQLQEGNRQLKRANTSSIRNEMPTKVERTH